MNVRSYFTFQVSWLHFGGGPDLPRLPDGRLAGPEEQESFGSNDMGSLCCWDETLLFCSSLSPNSLDSSALYIPGWCERTAIISWTLEIEIKRNFAVYLEEILFYNVVGHMVMITLQRKP